MADMKNYHDVSVDRKQHPVPVGFASIKELAHLKRKLGIFWCEGTAMGKLGKRGYRFSQFPEPAQAIFARALFTQPLRMVSKSVSARAVCSTRKAMFHAQFFKGLFSGPHASRLEVGISLPDALYRFLIILPRPVEVRS
jgi:hypothetical protein